MKDFRTPPPARFEDEYPEAADILMTFYAEEPRYERAGKKRYFGKRIHLTKEGYVLEAAHNSRNYSLYSAPNEG